MLNITSGTRLLSLSFFFLCHLFVLILLFVVDAYIIMLGKQITVPFRIVRPSRVTGPVDMDEIGHLSWVTAKVADA